MKDEKLIKGIAAWRISGLFELAETNTKKESRESEALAKRYILLAKKISAHYKVKIPKEMKTRICNSCNAVLIPGISCRVRITKGPLIIYLCNCGSEKKEYIGKQTQRPLRNSRIA